MKRIQRRAVIALMLAASIALGMCFFLWRLVKDGESWATYRANAHVYSYGNLRNAQFTDRNGVVLVHAENGVYTYADDPSVRLASLHVLGDHRAYVGGGAMRMFTDKLAGYSFVNGTPEEVTSVALTLDSRVQKAAWEALYGRAGAVMVMNYETGEILCMVSSPSYDPNLSPDMSVDGLFINRVRGAAFTPGSVFKMVTLVAAYENIPDLESRTFNCKKTMKVAGEKVTCTGKHGKQNVTEAFANSCNIAFGKLALELGGDTLRETAERLGVAGSLPFYDSVTASGRFDVAPAGSLMEAWSGIGQYNDLVTPYAMTRLCAAIANGGVVNEPTLLASAPQGSTRLMTEDCAAYLAGAMEYAGRYHYGGTFPGLDISGKTGTAEIGGGETHAWFAGYLRSGAPLAIAVVLEHGGGGLKKAAPVANLVLQAALESYS